MPEYGKTRKCFKICSMFFCFTVLVIHYGVGIGAYEVSYLAQHFDEETARRVVENYAGNILPGFYILYIPIAGIFIIHLIMLIMKKTIYSRRMICFSPILLMGIFALIPDIRQALGCHLTTLDYVCSQCSGNVSPFPAITLVLWYFYIWFLYGTLNVKEFWLGGPKGLRGMDNKTIEEKEKLEEKTDKNYIRN